MSIAIQFFELATYAHVVGELVPQMILLRNSRNRYVLIAKMPMMRGVRFTFRLASTNDHAALSSIFSGLTCLTGVPIFILHCYSRMFLSCRLRCGGWIIISLLVQIFRWIFPSL